jgi:transposase InsO family protein
MPWKDASAMSLRSEFIALASGQGTNLSELARRFEISRKTAYKWLARARAGELPADRSRRPKSSPQRAAMALEAAIVDLRTAHPRWGARKLARVLHNRHFPGVPALSTITDILRRHGLIEPSASAQRTACKRFEHPSPNDLWQMDFKGTIIVGQGTCDPLTALDDHSRYNLVLRATTSQRGEIVQNALTDAFRRYGLPRCINTDNGNPWGVPSGRSSDLSTFAIWLVRVGIHLSWSAPGHPQTNGKEERFHRSFKAEVLQGRTFVDLAHAQRAFDEWRTIYNEVRPHEGIDLAVPADRYQPSPRPFPEVLPAIEYAPQDVVLKVDARGRTRLQHYDFVVSTALGGHYIAARPRDGEDGVFDLYFSHQKMGEIDLNDRR